MEKEGRKHSLLRFNQEVYILDSEIADQALLVFPVWEMPWKISVLNETTFMSRLGKQLSL